MRSRLISFVILFLVGCGPSAGEEAARQAARDPSSAQFRNMKDTDAGTCGEMNSKNAFGAYAGFVPFVYDKTTKEIGFRPEEVGTEAEMAAALHECQQAMDSLRTDNPVPKYEGARVCGRADDLRNANSGIKIWEAARKRVCT